MQYFGKTSAESDELEDIGREILSNCNGLQLAVKSVGRLLSLKTRIEQWQRVLNSEMWPLEEIEKGGFPTLLLSYSDLPVNLKKYCAIFPKDYEIEKDRLIKLWMTQGHLKNGKKEMIWSQMVKSVLKTLLCSLSFKILKKKVAVA